MKIKVYTIDFELPRWLKRRFVYLGVPLLLALGGVVIAAPNADTSHIAQNGKIYAQKLKDNLDYLISSLNTVSSNLATQKSRLDNLKPKPTGIKTLSLPVGIMTSVKSDPCTGILISGGCATDGTAYVQAAAADGTATTVGTSYICNFYNPGPGTATGAAQAYCLTP